MLHPRLDWIPATLWLLLLLNPALVYSKPVRVTIDDAEGDPTTGQRIVYSPNWSAGHLCASCFVKLDKEKVHLGTWHDATSHPRQDTRFATVRFRGTSVRVKAILVGAEHTASTGIGGLDPEYYFSINGTHEHSFVREAQEFGGVGFLYDTTIFEDTNLPFGEHELVIRVGSGAKMTLLLLDSVEYEYDDETDVFEDPVLSATEFEPTSNKDKNLLIIAAVVPSSIVLLLLVIIAFLLHYIRRLRRQLAYSNPRNTNSSFQRLSSDNQNRLETPTPFMGQLADLEGQPSTRTTGISKPSLFQHGARGMSSSSHPLSAGQAALAGAVHPHDGGGTAPASRVGPVTIRPEALRSPPTPSTMPPAYAFREVLGEDSELVPDGKARYNPSS